MTSIVHPSVPVYPFDTPFSKTVGAVVVMLKMSSKLLIPYVNPTSSYLLNTNSYSP